MNTAEEMILQAKQSFATSAIAFKLGQFQNTLKSLYFREMD